MTLDYATAPYHRAERIAGRWVYAALVLALLALAAAWLHRASWEIYITVMAGAILVVRFPLTQRWKVLDARHARAIDWWQGTRLARNYTGETQAKGIAQLIKVHAGLAPYMEEQP